MRLGLPTATLDVSTRCSNCPVMSETNHMPLVPRIPTREPRKVLVQRNPLPTVNRMLADAYHALGSQLGRYKALAERETFSVKDATAFNKLVSSLTTLQETERRNTALLELGKLTEAELKHLASQASEIVQSGASGGSLGD